MSSMAGSGVRKSSTRHRSGALATISLALLHGPIRRGRRVCRALRLRRSGLCWWCGLCRRCGFWWGRCSRRFRLGGLHRLGLYWPVRFGQMVSTAGLRGLVAAVVRRPALSPCIAVPPLHSCSCPQPSLRALRVGISKLGRTSRTLGAPRSLSVLSASSASRRSDSTTDGAEAATARSGLAGGVSRGGHAARRVAGRSGVWVGSF
jgi:hypothetical protein